MFRAIALTAVLLAAGTANAQTYGHNGPPAVRLATPAADSERALDVLLARYDAALARRDRLDLRRVEDRVKQVLRAEVMEGRFEARRYGVRTDDVPQARRILQQLDKLADRFGRRSLVTKRELLAQASRLDLDDRPERMGEGRRPHGRR
ncbi:MAG TPA: hypothetical protein VGK67_28520 [Myxococcales bacterium]|jgi:beta-glucosidase-like glycosyl hydrolase